TGAIVLAQTPQAVPPPQQPRVTIGYVEVAGDARYEPITGFGRLVLKTRERPYTGAQVGLDEAQALSRVSKIDFALERISVRWAPTGLARAQAFVVSVLQARGSPGCRRPRPAGAARPSPPWPAGIRGRGCVTFHAPASDNRLRRYL